MNSRFRIACVVASLALCASAHADVGVDYTITSDASSGPQSPPRRGTGRVTTVIDGTSFRSTSGHGQLESSVDDGTTTFFGTDRSVTQSPLVEPPPDLTAPITARFDDERLVVGASTEGPMLFGVPTRVYTVDHSYTIVARIAYVVTRRTVHRTHYTLTVADLGVSNAAVRVFLSRGYGHALSQHPQAFTGVPLQIDGTIESDEAQGLHRVIHLLVKADALRR